MAQYYSIIRGFSDLLGEEGILRLPGYLPEVFIRSKERDLAIREATDRLLGGENVLIVGPPGAGKTALMFMILREIFNLGYKIGYILEGPVIVTNEHLREGIILFYDDIPRMDVSALRSIVRNRVKNIVATGRAEEVAMAERICGIQFGDVFSIIRIRPMSDDLIRKMLIRYADKEAIKIVSEKAIDEVVKKAEGLPVYVWQVIRELKIVKKDLDEEFARRIPQGMLDYVDDILWRIIGGVPERYEVLLTLLIMTDLVKYEINQDLYSYVYLIAKELRLGRKLSIKDIMFDEVLDNVTRYLARDATTFSFRLPHDFWADVLRGKSNGPIAPEIAKINTLYSIEERRRILIEAARRAWGRLEKADDEFKKRAFLRNLEMNFDEETIRSILERVVEEDVPRAPPEIVGIPDIEEYMSVLGRKITKPLKDRDVKVVENLLSRIERFLRTPKEKNIAGVAFMRLWEKTKIEDYFKRGEKLLLEAKNAKAYYNLGVAFIRRGDYNQAKKYLEKALELNPMNKHIRHNLALVELRLGNKKKAKLILKGKILGSERGEAE